MTTVLPRRNFADKKKRWPDRPQRRRTKRERQWIRKRKQLRKRRNKMIRCEGDRKKMRIESAKKPNCKNRGSSRSNRKPRKLRRKVLKNHLISLKKMSPSVTPALSLLSR
jgi:hypothetical protein